MYTLKLKTSERFVATFCYFIGLCFICQWFPRREHSRSFTMVKHGWLCILRELPSSNASARTKCDDVFFFSFMLSDNIHVLWNGAVWKFFRLITERYKSEPHGSLSCFQHHYIFGSFDWKMVWNVLFLGDVFLFYNE